jgi:hypothetical protein
MILDSRDFRYDLGGTFSFPSSFYGEETEYVPLPSKGIFYPEPYKNIQEIKIKKISYIEENLLTTESYYKNKTITYEILKSVVVDKSFPIELLVEIDILAILIWVRISGFGISYNVKYKCPYCGTINTIDWNLGELQLSDPQYFPEDNNMIKHIANETTYYLLPKTLYRENLAKKFLLNKNDNSKTSLFLLTVICEVIDKQGVKYQTIEEIYSFIKRNELSLKEYRKIQNIIKHCLPTIINKQNCTCKECGYNYNINFEWNEYSFGLLSQQYKEYLEKSINFLTFWGRIDYQSVLRMPTYKRRDWINMTQENLKILFPKPKK